MINLTLDSFIKNQKINIIRNDDNLLVTTLQNYSTPGIIVKKVNFNKNTINIFKINIKKNKNVKIFFYYKDILNDKNNFNKKRIYLDNGINIIFFIINNNNIYDIGFLFTNCLINNKCEFNNFSFNYIKFYNESQITNILNDYEKLNNKLQNINIIYNHENLNNIETIFLNLDNITYQNIKLNTSNNKKILKFKNEGYFTIFSDNIQHFEYINTKYILYDNYVNIKINKNSQINIINYTYLYIDNSIGVIYPSYLSTIYNTINSIDFKVDFNKINEITSKFSENPLVSIIITTYNSDKYIIKCIEMIRLQTYNNIEIIVIDDCSTDNTAILLNDYVKTNKLNIKIHFNKTNLGTYVSRNIGIDISNGDIICFQDTDDISHPDRIRKQVDILKQGYLFTVCNYSIINYNEYIDLYTNFNLNYDQIILNKIRNKNYKFMYKQSYPIASITFMTTKKILNKLGYFLNARIGSDIEYFERIIYYFTGIYYYFYEKTLKKSSITIHKILSVLDKPIPKIFKRCHNLYYFGLSLQSGISLSIPSLMSDIIRIVYYKNNFKLYNYKNIIYFFDFLHKYSNDINFLNKIFNVLNNEIIYNNNYHIYTYIIQKEKYTILLYIQNNSIISIKENNLLIYGTEINIQYNLINDLDNNIINSDIYYIIKKIYDF